MNLTGKHTIKTIILWIGIVTAILLIIGSFFQFGANGLGIELNPTLFNHLDQLSGFISVVQETLQWIKL